MIDRIERIRNARADPRIAPLLVPLPPGLFGRVLFHSIELLDCYGLDLSRDVLRRLGVDSGAHAPSSAEETCRTHGFVPAFAELLHWLLRCVQAADAAACTCDGGVGGTTELERLRAAALEVDPANAATLDLMDRAAGVYPQVARGETSARDALLTADTLALWTAYFSNGNPLYGINNRVAAAAAAERLTGLDRIRVLEVGAGAGSGGEALVRTLRDRGLAERFTLFRVTEPSAFLLRRARRTLGGQAPATSLQFAALDIDRPWAEQLPEGARFDLVYGVNVFHVARDLVFTLRQAARVLTPRGWLVAGECLRPWPKQQLFVELVFKLLEGDVIPEPGLRDRPGFLTPEQWIGLLRRAEFETIEIVPDLRRIRGINARLFVGAMCARRQP